MKKHFLSLLLGLPILLNAQIVNVHISNPSELQRNNETVEISWKTISSKLKLKNNAAIIVVDENGKEYPSQLLYEGKKQPQKFIFQVSLGAKKAIDLLIKYGNPQTYETAAYGRYVPERRDDYAWENDRVAFRIYGPALIEKDGPSNGIDIWCKRTDKMIINQRYEKELSGKGSYHIDWGDGLDLYKVGRTLGAGAMAPFVKDSLWLASNYATQETLDNGPIRTSFKLTYAPFNVNGTSVKETRIISLDAGSQFSKIVESFECAGKMEVVAGIVKRSGADSTVLEAKKGYAIYSEPPTEKDGSLNIAVVNPKGWNSATVTKGHILASATYKSGTKLTYYSGYGWSKWGFLSRISWVKYVSDFTNKLQQPLRISVK